MPNENHQNEQPPADQTDSETQAPENAKSESRKLPEPSLLILAQMFYTEGMIALGVVPNPGSSKVEKDLPAVRFQIGMLEMLQEKTRGNRTPDEEQLLEEMLHALRMAFVEVSKQ